MQFNSMISLIVAALALSTADAFKKPDPIDPNTWIPRPDICMKAIRKWGWNANEWDCQFWARYIGGYSYRGDCKTCLKKGSKETVVCSKFGLVKSCQWRPNYGLCEIAIRKWGWNANEWQCDVHIGCRRCHKAGTSGEAVHCRGDTADSCYWLKEW